MTNSHNLSALDLQRIDDLDDLQVAYLARQLCAPPMPLTDRERREALAQYVADGGVLDDLR